MATHRIPILGANTVPDSSGRVWMEPYSIAGSNDVWQHMVSRFKDPSGGQRHGVYGKFTVPKNYVGTAKIVVVWTSTATSGNCRWEFDYRTVGGDDTTSLDQAGTEESAAVTDAAPTAAHRRLEALITLTSANLAVDEEVEFYFVRDDDGGTDTMAADALLFSLILEYADA